MNRPRTYMKTTRGFTLVELLVVVGVLGLTIVTAAQIFQISSDATVRTDANATVIRRAQQTNAVFEREVSKMANGVLLAIECRPPIPNVVELKGGNRYPIRQDRITFVTRGDNGEYESFTDRRRPTFADPNARPASSSEAIVFFGPGIPMTKDLNSFVSPIPLTDPQITAPEWIFLHRAILLLGEKRTDIPTGSFDPSISLPRISDLLTTGGIFNTPSGMLFGPYQQNAIDLIVSDDLRQASAKTVSEIVMSKDLFGDLLTASPSISPLLQSSWAPRTVRVESLYRNARDHYTRSGSNFVPGLADFRVEWTDGGIDDLGPDLIPNTGDEGGTRWFGLRPAPGINMDNAELNRITNPTTIGRPVNIAVMRSDPAYANAAGYQSVEWSQNALAAGQDSAYRAIWRADTWDLRPKALRFTYRLYDESNRLKQSSPIDFDRDGDFDPDDANFATNGDNFRREFVRLGREFSVVVKVP